ncbi:protein PLASTID TRANSCRIPTIONALLY ACTIVE 7 [Typha latifolia]|uniref:protein PLASTID TRANSCRIPTIONALLY ACTIVE 7 n=1 Tax=Typha latifolia TaxID=4733 RepID=UPI003C3055E8
MALAAHHLIRYSLSLPAKAEPSNYRLCWSSSRSRISAKSQEGEGGSGRRIWRRRRLTKKDDKLRYKMDRIPFLEEQVRKIRENGKIISMDIEKLMLSEENRFAFVNEVAAEATSYIENNRDEYGSKKAILHVLSNRMNEAGFHRSEAYMEPDPFKPGPNYLKEGF